MALSDEIKHLKNKAKAANAGLASYLALGPQAPEDVRNLLAALESARKELIDRISVEYPMIDKRGQFLIPFNGRQYAARIADDLMRYT